MARTTRSNKIFTTDFCKAVRTALNEMLDRGETEGCVKAIDVAKHKAVAKAFTVKNTERLKLLVMTAVSEGQVAGFSIRVGRDGGIHRVAVASKKVRKAVVATVTPAANDTVESAPAATGTEA